MQVKDNPSIAPLAKRRLLLITKVIVSLLCLFFLSWKLSSQQELINTVDFPRSFPLILLVILGLMLLNWYLEIVRWEQSIQQFEPTSKWSAAKDVLGGLAMNWVFPMTSGDFIARIASKKNKFQAASAIVLNRSIMLLLTILYGAYGIFHYGVGDIGLNYWFLIVLVVLGLLLILSKKWFKKFWVYFNEMKRPIAVRIASLSVLRYSVYAFQFYILLKLFLPTFSDSTLFAGIGWIFFCKSVLPSLFGGFGLREVSAYVFFEPLVTDITLVLLPVFLIWIVNTAIPSMIGSVLVYKLKFSIA